MTIMNKNSEAFEVCYSGHQAILFTLFIKKGVNNQIQIQLKLL